MVDQFILFNSEAPGGLLANNLLTDFKQVKAFILLRTLGQFLEGGFNSFQGLDFLNYSSHLVGQTCSVPDSSVLRATGRVSTNIFRWIK